MDSSDSGYGAVVCSCKHGTKPTRPINFGGISWLAERLVTSQEQLLYLDSAVSQPVNIFTNDVVL